jgi:hypothetical protein
MILTDFAYGGQMQVCYQFDRPFKTGGHWIAYGSMNGHSALYLGKGTYSVIDTNLAK